MNQDIIINIPQGAKINVSIGTPIGLTTKLYTVSDTEDVLIPITKPLKTKPEEIFQLLNHVIGYSIKLDELLAVKRGVLGTKKVYSPVEGKLKIIDHETGEVVIEVQKTATKDFLSPADGVVTQIDQNRGSLSISISPGDEIEVDFITNLTGGEMSFIELGYMAADLTNIKDKVIINEKIMPATASKFEALDAIAFVYLSGNHSADLPHAKVKDSKEFEKLKNSNKKKAVMLPKIKRIIVY